MRFPVTFALGPLTFSAHLLFELLAWAVAFALLRVQRTRSPDVLERDPRWTLSVAAVLGAVLGAKVVHWTSELPALRAAFAHGATSGLFFLLGGKSLVGALLGGTLAVELARRRLGIRERVGDAYVLPLCAAIAIGRVGCFLAGLGDHTHGTPTGLPWAVVLEDGVARHPVQLYEIAALAVLALVLTRARPRLAQGVLFDAFLLAYLALRVGLDFLKPYPRVLGLSGTQIWALLGIAARLAFLRARGPDPREGTA